MSAEIGHVLAELPAWAFGFVLILCRTGAALMLAPGFGEAEIPTMVRAGLAMIIAGLLVPALAARMPAPDIGIPALLTAIFAELATGFALGWLARLPASALPLAGQTAAQMAGFSNVIAPGPDAGQSALSRLFGLAVPVIVFGSGMHGLILTALSGSYDLIPVGHFLPVADTAEAVLGAVTDAFLLGLRLAAPFIVAGLVWQIGLGLLARLVPQVQVYFLAMPGQVLGGLLMLALLGAAMAQNWQEAMLLALSSLPGH